MPTDRLKAHRPDVPDMSADSISGRRFGQSWRGFDPEEVKAFLAQVASQVRSLRERLDDEATARREAEQRASHPEMDEAALMTAVGDETAGILRTARSAASEITAKAQSSADALLGEAEAKATELIGEATAVLATKTAEAEAAAAELLAQAQARAEELQAEAQRQANEVRDEAQQKYQETVEAAQAVRERILSDLARRRKLGSVQVEQLRAGRERLLDAYLVVRRTLEEVTDELQRADAEARAAADAVGRQGGGDHADELVDLRADEGFDLPAAPGGGASTAQVAPEPAAPVTHPAPVVHAVPLVTVPAASGVTTTVPAKVSHPAAVLTLPSPPTSDPAALSEASAAASAIVSRSDAIESVRILPRDLATQTTPRVQPEGPGLNAPEAGPVVADNGREVDDLFARIRAGRSEAAASARKTLSDDSSVAEMAHPEGTLDQSKSDASVLDEDVAGLEPAVSEGGTATDQADGDLLQQRDAITAHLESSLARKLKRALQDEQNSLLDRLRALKGAPTAARVLPSPEEHPDRFVETGRPILEEAARAGANLASDLAGKKHAPVIKATVVDDLAEELGRSIAEPLRQRLEAAFRSDDEDPSELADALGAAYREWKTQRIEAAARDQVAAAFCRGSYIAMAQGTFLRWVVSAAEGPCPDCEDNALAGNQPKGEAWPTGQLYPPAHPGCRCVLAPAQTADVGSQPS